MKSAYISALALLMAVAGAQAADLPTKKGAAAAPAKPSCFSDVLTYFDSSPADCPLSAYGITLYATIDMGFGYETHGVPWNPKYPTGVEELISKNSNRGQWALTPGGISQSQIGLKAREPLAYGWSFVGEVATGFDPYSLQLADGPGAMLSNTRTLLQNQNANGDSSRAGQWDNSVGYAGFSHDTFGTLTFGRQNALSLDGVIAYDPMGASYAFSPIGYSGKAAGDGSTEDARTNTALKYAFKYNMFRASALYQIGGYDLGNGSNGQWELGVGADYGGLSVDAIYTHVKDQVNLGTYNNPAKPAALTATLSNNDDVMLLGKYKWNQFTAFGGYEYIRYTNPSDKYAGGFSSIGGYPVLGSGVNSTNYTNPLHFDILWTGVKYAINDRLDITGAYYLYIQHDFNTAANQCGPNMTAPAPGYAPQGTAGGKCAGYLNALSAMIDYRPLKRVDLYAGLMYSKVSGGLASGFLYNNNLDPTVGIRIKF
ncbi:MAG: porin [Pseudomonadota bacterium]|nr:porin [Pseudomonadota bacterium]